MLPKDRDPAYIWDIVNAAKLISQFTHGKTFVDYEKDIQLQSAVERQLEIIGEAARRISSEFRAKSEDIPWRGLVGLRNVLAHEYGEILVERIWEVIEKGIPNLLIQLENLLPPLDE